MMCNSSSWKHLKSSVNILIIVLLCFDISGQKAIIKEESRSILTYPYSDPNPVPAMAVSSMVSPFYPYYVFDGYTDKGINKEWKVISLDNDYINVTVLPEVGGKVWGAIEKSTGLEFVYQNHVMKFRAIGIRGPWTSGGIEHNFGLDLGHAPWTSSPVDYIIKQNSDGSVSCIVGGLDLASRTQWRVNILLPKDKGYFETRSMWYNPTPLHDAYLSWENAGFKASGDLQFFFPGNFISGMMELSAHGRLTKMEEISPGIETIISEPANHIMYRVIIQTGLEDTGMMQSLDLVTQRHIAMLPERRYGSGHLPATERSGKTSLLTGTASILKPSQASNSTRRTGKAATTAHTISFQCGHTTQKPKLNTGSRW